MTPIEKIHRVRTSARCRKCMQEVSLRQVDRRNNARVPVLFHCPRHGTLYIHQVVYGQTEDVVLKSPIV